MSNVCSPNAGQPKSGLGSVLVYDAAKLAEFLLQEGMGWLSPFVPQIGGQSYDLSSFCSGDTPDAPNTDPTYILNLFNPTNGQAVVEQRDWLFGLVNWAVWYSSCECSAGTQPTPITPISQPPDLNLQPPSTSPSESCFSNSITGRSVNYANQFAWNFNDVLPGGNGNFDGQFYQRIVPTPLPSSIVLTAVNHGGGAHDYNCQLFLNFYTSAGGNITASNYGGVTFNVGATLTTPPIAVPPAAAFWAVIVTPVGGNTGTPTNTVDVSSTIYCQGQGPNTLGMVCCPTDPNLLSMLNEILRQVQEIYSIIPVRVPNYAAGTAHSGLSGGGNLTLDPTTIAVKVVFDTLPPNYGLVVGTPDTYLELGWLSPVTNEGVTAGLRLSRQAQVVEMPEATSALDYSFASSASVTITELQAG